MKFRERNKLVAIVVLCVRQPGPSLNLSFAHFQPFVRRERPHLASVAAGSDGVLLRVLRAAAASRTAARISGAERLDRTLSDAVSSSGKFHASGLSRIHAAALSRLAGRRLGSSQRSRSVCRVLHEAEAIRQKRI